MNHAKLATLCAVVALSTLPVGCERPQAGTSPVAPPRGEPARVGTVGRREPLLRIGELERSLPPVTRSQLVASAAHRSAAAELIGHLRDPDPEVRSAAYRALISFQPDCPPPDPDVWERWLQQLQDEAARHGTGDGSDCSPRRLRDSRVAGARGRALRRRGAQAVAVDGRDAPAATFAPASPCIARPVADGANCRIISGSCEQNTRTCGPARWTRARSRCWL